MGKSNSPMQQKSPCHIHGRNPWSATTGSAWELAQTKDPHGINNFHQDSDGKLVITGQGRTRCNYCKLPNHGRQRCPFRLRDLQYNIDRQFHPQKGCLGKTDTKSYIPNQSRGHRSPMSVRLANETDNSGHPRFWQTQCGHMIYSIDNQPQCSYCGIPSQGRDACQHRRKNEARGLFRIHHPQRGLIQQTEYIELESILNLRVHHLCDYCGVPSHPRAQCNTRIKDEMNGIKRAIHPNRGLIPSENQITRKTRGPTRSQNQTTSYTYKQLPNTHHNGQQSDALHMDEIYRT